MITEDIHHTMISQSINKSVIKLTAYMNSDLWFTVESQ